MIHVIPVNTPVRFGPPDDPIRGNVSAVCLREGRVTYEVVWWNGRSRSEAWLERSEFSLVDPADKPQVIGFRA